MAKFGSEVSAMNSPSLGGASFISQGVEDRSGEIFIKANTSLISDVGKMGVEAYRGYNLAGVDTEQQKVIQEYMDRRNPEQLKLDASALKQADISLFNQPGTTPEELAPVQQRFNDTMSRYKKAMDQGVMSPEEFSTRTLTVLRDAVTKNPGMMAELSDQANKVLELSGITSFVKQDIADRAKIASAHQQIFEYDMSIAKQYNIPIPRNNDGSVDILTLRKENAKVQMEQKVVEDADRQDKFTEDQFRTHGTIYATGLINNANNLAISILNDPSIPYEKALFNINGVLDSVEQSFATNPKVMRIIDKPSVNSTHTYIKDQIGAIKENIKKFASKEDAATYLKNSTNMLRDQQYQDLAKTVNPQAVEVLSKLLSTVGVADLISSRPEVKVQLFNTAKNLISGLPTGGSIGYEGVGSKNLAIQTFNSLAVDAGKEGDTKNLEALSNTIKSINWDSKNMPVDKKFSFYGDYIKALGSPVNKVGISKLDGNAISLATESVSDYMKLNTSDFLSIVQGYRDKGIKITVDPLPDGRISVHSDNKQVQEELTQKHIIRINDSLSAYANLTGSDTKSIAPKFYSSFMGISIPKPTFTRNSPQDVSGKIGGL